MVCVDLNKFAEAIRDTYPGYTEQAAANQSELWAQRLHPMLEEAVRCWIAGEPIENVSYQAPDGESFSIESIMDLRGDNDWLHAMLLLSDFINDPTRGRNRILSPRR